MNDKMREALVDLMKAARLMPRATPNPGAASTVHDYQIEAAYVWGLDQACNNAEAVLVAAVHEEVGQAKADMVAAMTATPSRPVMAGAAEPVAWVVFTKGGNVRLWGKDRAGPQAFADERGLKCEPVYLTAPPAAAGREEIAKAIMESGNCGVGAYDKAGKWMRIFCNDDSLKGDPHHYFADCDCSKACDAILALGSAVTPQNGLAAVLWCCHIRGPDDVHAAPDYETALKWADTVNALNWRAGNGGVKTPDPVSFEDCLLKAVPAVWPHSAQSHAEDLPKSIEGFAIRALAPKGAA